MDGRTDDSLIATGFLRAGPRVLFREKDNPERRYDYLDDMIGTIGKGMLGLTVNCARCHNHKFDPIPQKDYYALEASIFGYVETEYPLAPHGRGGRLPDEDRGDQRQDRRPAKRRSQQIEAPYRDTLQLEQIKRSFPSRSCQAASRKPKRERTPGEAVARDSRCSKRSTSPARRSTAS